MNFGEIIKKEILSKNIKEIHCRKAFLAGLIRGSGTLFEKDNELCLSFRINNEEGAMLISSYLKSLFDYDVREVSVHEDKRNKRDKFEITISGEEGVKILIDLGVLLEEKNDLIVNFNIFNDLTEKECCLKSFLRGLFVSSGVCLVPNYNDSKNTKYHLELVFSHIQPAMDVNGKLIEYGIFGKVTNRKDKYVLYIKKKEKIKDFIAFINANVSVLKLTDLMINKEMVNDANRRMNCDMWNVNKQVDASHKQIKAIEIIEKNKGLDSLKKNLRDVCLLRREYPEETLLELSERINLSKSCLNHRLRKIIEIAKEIEGEN